MLNDDRDCSYHHTVETTCRRDGFATTDRSATHDKPMFVVPNLLVTDDDKAFRKVVCEGLARRGFRVTEACDGREALDLIEHSQVHVALVDIHMPNVNGLDVIRHLHQRPSSPPCVLMSGELNDEIRREAQRMQVYDVLSKPVRLAQLTTIVSAALTEYYGWQPPQAS